MAVTRAEKEAEFNQLQEAFKGGMPVYKYISNRFLTAAENFALGQNLGIKQMGLACHMYHDQHQLLPATRKSSLAESPSWAWSMR